MATKAGGDTMRWLASIGISGLVALICGGTLQGTVKAQQSAAAAHYRQGLEHDKQGEDDQALEDFKRAIQLDPQSFESYKVLNDALSRQG